MLEGITLALLFGAKDGNLSPLVMCLHPVHVLVPNKFS